MWIQVRTFDGKKTVNIEGLSKLTKVEELRKRIEGPFEGAEPSRQQLFYRGKLLVNGHTLFDYNVGLNDLIQLMVLPKAPVAPKDEGGWNTKGTENEEDDADDATSSNSSDKENTDPLPGDARASTSSQPKDDTSGSIFKIGDIVDGRDSTTGAWFEAKLTQISRRSRPARKSTDGNSITPPLQQEMDPLNCDRKDMAKENTKKEEKPTGAALEETNTNCLDSNKSHSEKKISEKGQTVDENCNQVEESIENKEVQWKEKLLAGVSIVDDGFVYSTVFVGYEDDDPVVLPSTQLRPRARQNIEFKKIEIGQKVMANYNYDAPEDRGYWYDCIITGKCDTRIIKDLIATVFIGADLTPLENCQLLFRDEVFAIEAAGTQMNETEVAEIPELSPTKRVNKPECNFCKDHPSSKCKECACCVCGGKNNPEKQVLCDECDVAYHLDCLKPPLTQIPQVDEWYCPECKVDDTKVVKKGEVLKESKKKAMMPSAKSSTNRDWGKGMACVGRTKECTLVPRDHFGPIPSVEVGTMWKFRVQVSEVGIHRPPVAGIHGREESGAFSIVLSGGYEDDVDNGDDFTYTGSGGRDLSGNKRTAAQSCDQTLTRYNKALARNCNASLDDKKGAEAKDWRAGRPVRVVRNWKGRKHSKYAPEEGNRYDGIYKIVKYWPDKGKSGFLVWRYMLRRDDPQSAPWTASGKKRCKELGLRMQYPEGYLEAQALKEQTESPSTDKKKRKKSLPVESPSKKRQKVATYKPEPEVSKLIKEDSVNKKLWNDVIASAKEGSNVFFSKVEEMFRCVCCQELVFKPITTECRHNVCKSCIQRSFQAEIYTCPSCRAELGKDYSMASNKTLTNILGKLFPGYEEAGRRRRS